MTPPRSQTLGTDVSAERIADGDETPDLNLYEIHDNRTVLTEPGNTDGWIATDMTVTPPE